MKHISAPDPCLQDNSGLYQTNEPILCVNKYVLQIKKIFKTNVTLSTYRTENRFLVRYVPPNFHIKVEEQLQNFVSGARLLRASRDLWFKGAFPMLVQFESLRRKYGEQEKCWRKLSEILEVSVQKHVSKLE